MHMACEIRSTCLLRAYALASMIMMTITGDPSRANQAVADGPTAACQDHIISRPALSSAHTGTAIHGLAFFSIS